MIIHIKFSAIFRFVLVPLLVMGGLLFATAHADAQDADPGTPADCVQNTDGTYTCESPVEPTTTTAPSDCAEDDPCWDCATMGNHACGFYEDPEPQPDYPVPAGPTPATPIPASPQFTG